MVLGPNTNMSSDLLRPNCIVCCGEDWRTFLEALKDVGLFDADAVITEYRCYRFWQHHSLLVIWTGIGTGCLEPLLWEILQRRVIRRIFLIGTAGRLSSQSVTIGRAYVIDEAWAAGTGVDDVIQPLAPKGQYSSYERRSSVSTDFFYGFSELIIRSEYPLILPKLQALYEFHLRRGTALVEMEVAQFYTFCSAFGDATLEFAAIKGVSNDIGEHGEQLASSQAAIADSLRIARDIITSI